MTTTTDRYQLAPPLSPTDRERLTKSIREHGVIVPVTVDQHGHLLDGHHRREIASTLGVDCPTTEVTCASEEERLALAASLNADRRQMTDGQRTILGRTLEARYEALARERMADAGTKAAPGKPGSNVPPFRPEPRRTRDDVADAVGLGSGKTYERNSKALDEIEREAPDLLPAVEAGTMTIPEAKKHIRQRDKAEKVAAIAAQTPAPLDADGTFPVLYVDPPWRYEHAEPTRAVENNYPTMSLDEIKAMDPPADDDAVLFLWATSPKLAEAFQVLDAWGFGYRTCAVWVKDRIGMGYYFRQRHELLLVAARGSLPVPDPEDRPDSVIEAPRGEHSAKPDRAYELIERMYPLARKVELFARQPRDGWAAWGNQVEAVA